MGYTKEAIRERIEKCVKAQEKFPVKKKFPFPKRPDTKRTLIDTDKEKFQENGALKRWADIQNLKIAAASYAEGGSVEELKRKIEEKNAAAKAASLDVEKMQAKYDAMTVQKAKLKRTYQTTEKEAAEAEKQLKNIRQYLGIESDKKESIKQHKQQDVSL